MSEEYEDGRYDWEAERLILSYPGTVAALVIMIGAKSGFSVSAADPQVIAEIPRILRHLADDIEQQTRAQSWKRVKTSDN